MGSTIQRRAGGIELLLDYGAHEKATDGIGNTACSLSEANLEMRENASGDPRLLSHFLWSMDTKRGISPPGWI